MQQVVRKCLLGALAFWLACSSNNGKDSDTATNEGDGEEGIATGSVCPTDSWLDYESFGRKFMTDYCTRCHSSALAGPAARSNAPVDHDFDSLAGVMEVAEHIDEYAAAGPKGVNVVMPPSGKMPTEDERRQLGEWLACELAK